MIKIAVELLDFCKFQKHNNIINYKDECDPFCADAFTDTCIYLKEMRKLWDVFDRDW